MIRVSLVRPIHIHPGYAAALAHRISGLLLVLFLPVHFLLLGTALQGRAEFARYLAYTDNPLVKIAEWGLVMLLSLHLFFGLRVLLIELTKYPDHRRRLSAGIIPGLAASTLIGIVFLCHVFG